MADKTDDFSLARFVRSEKVLPITWAKNISDYPVEADWARFILFHDTANIRAAEWYIECALAGARLIRDSVVVDPDRRGGIPVLMGTGFTVSQTLVELADSSGVVEVADEFDLDADVIRKMLNGLSLLLGKPHSS
jgi:uncharacterized protein (DUF433 family)